MRKTALAANPSPSLPVQLHMRRGRVIFPARRPTTLVFPLGAITEIGGVLCILNGASIGWFIVAAPVVALTFTGLILRPRVELTRDGVVQRQYPFSTLTKWEVIDHFGITGVGNRVVLAYKLKDGIPPPRRQPAAAMLRAAEKPYDGGYFADSLAAKPEDVLNVVRAYLGSETLRNELPVFNSGRR